MRFVQHDVVVVVIDRFVRGRIDRYCVRHGDRFDDADVFGNLLGSRLPHGLFDGFGSDAVPERADGGVDGPKRAAQRTLAIFVDLQRPLTRGLLWKRRFQSLDFLRPLVGFGYRSVGFGAAAVGDGHRGFRSFLGNIEKARKNVGSVQRVPEQRGQGLGGLGRHGSQSLAQFRSGKRRRNESRSAELEDFENRDAIPNGGDDVALRFFAGGGTGERDYLLALASPSVLDFRQAEGLVRRFDGLPRRGRRFFGGPRLVEDGRRPHLHGMGNDDLLHDLSDRAVGPERREGTDHGTKVPSDVGPLLSFGCETRQSIRGMRALGAPSRVPGKT